MKKSIIILGITGLFIPISIKAGSVSLSCSDTSVTKGSSTTCTLSGSSSEEVSALSAKLSSNGGVSISNVNISSGWQGDGSGGSIDLYTDNNKSGGFGIVTFTVSVNGEGSVSVDGVTFSDANFNESSASGRSVSIGVKEEVNVEPKKEETINTQPTQNINPNTNNDSSSNNVVQNTSEENNKIKKSSDASLRELSISNGSIDFNSNTLNYIVEVSHDVDKISISAIANDSNATVKIPSDLSLKDGNNKFIVEVTAQDGTKKQYELNVKRLDKVLSNDSSLKSLSISGYDINFNIDKYVYDIGEVKMSSLKVDAIANDSSAIVKIYGDDSIGEDDVIVIEVEAEDKTKTEYIIYANNILSNNHSSSKVAMFIVWILFLVSLGFNVYLFIDKRKKDGKK